MIETLQNVIDDAALAAYEALTSAGAALANPNRFDGGYAMDAAAGTITFSGAEPLTSSFQLVGTCADATGGWQWGWANTDHANPASLEASQRVLGIGQQFGLAELTAPHRAYMVSAEVDSLVYGLVASVINDCRPLVRVPMSGLLVALLVDDEALRWGPPTPEGMEATMRQLNDLGLVIDWRRALRSYASLRRVGLDETDTRLSLDTGRGRLNGAFKGNQITGLSTSA